jgi:hypothetical protein
MMRLRRLWRPFSKLSLFGGEDDDDDMVVQERTVQDTSVVKKLDSIYTFTNTFDAETIIRIIHTNHQSYNELTFAADLDIQEQLR